MNRLLLEEKHKAKGAKFIDFGGWYMPVQYKGIIAEHLLTRENKGFFDISHMGKIFINGAESEKYLNYITTANVSAINAGQAVYTFFLNENAGIIDDLIIYKNSFDDFLLIVNAANTAKDYEWLKKHSFSYDCSITNKSGEYCLFALQGPKSFESLTNIFSFDTKRIKRFGFEKLNYSGYEIYIARTGYTGEDGAEILIPNNISEMLFDKFEDELLNSEGGFVGLGARDTLRLEAGYMLHGNDIDETTTPLEAGLGWVLKGKNYFGEDALNKQRQNGIEKKLYGFIVTDKGIARHDCKIFSDGVYAGRITSGTMSPSLNKSLGLAYINEKFSGKPLYADVRGKNLKIEICKTPFIKKI